MKNNAFTTIVRPGKTYTFLCHPTKKEYICIFCAAHRFIETQTSNITIICDKMLPYTFEEVQQWQCLSDFVRVYTNRDKICEVLTSQNHIGSCKAPNAFALQKVVLQRSDTRLSLVSMWNTKKYFLFVTFFDVWKLYNCVVVNGA